MKSAFITLAVILIIIIAGLGIFYYLQTQNYGLSGQANKIGSNQSVATGTNDNSQAIESNDVISVATKSGNLKTFVAAVIQAELNSSLKSGGPYTIFVPTDQAFGKIDQETAKKLISDKEYLISVLQNHIINGTYLKSDLQDGRKLENMNQSQLTINNKNDSIKVNNANIVTADIMATNGVIHSIDTILINK